jgi:hypothetical protein
MNRKVLLVVALVFGSLAVLHVGGSRAHAQRFELRTHIGGGLRAPDPGFRLGLGLGDHTVLMTGVDFALEKGTTNQAFGAESYERWRTTIPVEVLVRILEPQEGAIVPTARFGVTYGVSDFDGESAMHNGLGHELGLTTLFGATYFPVERVGIGMEIGPHVRRRWNGTHGVLQPADGWVANVLWRLGMTVRV